MNDTKGDISISFIIFVVNLKLYAIFQNKGILLRRQEVLMFVLKGSNAELSFLRSVGSVAASSGPVLFKTLTEFYSNLKVKRICSSESA
jgi:hypothetical protein